MQPLFETAVTGDDVPGMNHAAEVQAHAQVDRLARGLRVQRKAAVGLVAIVHQ